MRLIAGLFAALTLTLIGASAHAHNTPEPIGGEQLAAIGTPVVSPAAPVLPEIDAASWLIADLNTGDVLAARNAHLPLPPASTLKLLAALVLLPDIDPGLTYDATDGDASVEGSRVGLVPEETYSKSDLEHGLMLASGNDAAHALAEIAGGQQAGVAAMNAEAIRLGAFNTAAKTPHGLDEPGQVSTAYDLALIARAALADEGLAELMQTTTYDFPGLDGATYQIQNQNRLLGRYEGAIGLKTGYTSGAGHTRWLTFMPMPTKAIVRPAGQWSPRRRSRTAISSGGPAIRRIPRASRKASSIESASTRGVVSSNTTNKALLASEYASIRGFTTTASGHSRRACPPPMAVRTPRAFAS
jgi:D-alanyl-D-alanine carboxypeptidase